MIVTEGKVVLGAANPAASGETEPSPGMGQDSVVLAPADLGEVLPSGAVRRQSGGDFASALAWTEGRLVFSMTRLDAVVAELDRWYDIRVELADPRLAARTFTGTFGDEPATEVLEVIRASLGLALQRDGNRFVLRGAP